MPLRYTHFGSAEAAVYSKWPLAGRERLIRDKKEARQEDNLGI